MPAVTTRVPLCRIAAIPATSSHRRMIAPPWTWPAVFASSTPIQRVRTELVLAGRRGSTTPDSTRWLRAAALSGQRRLAHNLDRLRERRTHSRWVVLPRERPPQLNERDAP